MFQADVKVLGLIRLDPAQGHTRLADELVMRQLVFITHRHSERQRQSAKKTDREDVIHKQSYWIT